MKTAEASLFMVAANGSTNRDISSGMPYWSQAMKAFGRLTTLRRKEGINGKKSQYYFGRRPF